MECHISLKAQLISLFHKVDFKIVKLFRFKFYIIFFFPSSEGKILKKIGFYIYEHDYKKDKKCLSVVIQLYLFCREIPLLTLMESIKSITWVCLFFCKPLFLRIPKRKILLDQNGPYIGSSLSWSVACFNPFQLTSGL